MHLAHQQNILKLFFEMVGYKYLLTTYMQVTQYLYENSLTQTFRI